MAVGEAGCTEPPRTQTPRGCKQESQAWYGQPPGPSGPRICVWPGEGVAVGARTRGFLRFPLGAGPQELQQSLSVIRASWSGKAAATPRESWGLRRACDGVVVASVVVVRPL